MSFTSDNSDYDSESFSIIPSSASTSSNSLILYHEKQFDSKYQMSYKSVDKLVEYFSLP